MPTPGAPSALLEPAYRSRAQIKIGDLQDLLDLLKEQGDGDIGVHTFKLREPHLRAVGFSVSDDSGSRRHCIFPNAWHAHSFAVLDALRAIILDLNAMKIGEEFLENLHPILRHAADHLRLAPIQQSAASPSGWVPAKLMLRTLLADVELAHQMLIGDAASILKARVARMQLSRYGLSGKMSREELERVLEPYDGNAQGMWKWISSYRYSISRHANDSGNVREQVANAAVALRAFDAELSSRARLIAALISRTRISPVIAATLPEDVTERLLPETVQHALTDNQVVYVACGLNSALGAEVIRAMIAQPAAERLWMTVRADRDRIDTRLRELAPGSSIQVQHAEIAPPSPTAVVTIDWWLASRYTSSVARLVAENPRLRLIIWDSEPTLDRALVSAKLASAFLVDKSALTDVPIPKAA